MTNALVRSPSQKYTSAVVSLNMFREVVGPDHVAKSCWGTSKAAPNISLFIALEVLVQTLQLWNLLKSFNCNHHTLPKSAKRAALVAHSRSGGQEQGCCFNGAKTSGSQVTRTTTVPGELIGRRSSTKWVYHGGSFVSWRSTMRLPPVSGLATCSVYHKPRASSHEFNLLLFVLFLSPSFSFYLFLSLSISSYLFLTLFISEKIISTPRGSLPHARHEGGWSLHDQLFCLGLRCVQKMPMSEKTASSNQHQSTPSKIAYIFTLSSKLPQQYESLTENM